MARNLDGSGGIALDRVRSDLREPAAEPEPTEPDDDALVLRARRGDATAFEALMRRHNRRLFRAARAVLGDEHEAEDAVQDAYLRAFTRLSLYGGGRFGAWLLTITLNEARGRRRRHRRAVARHAAEEVREAAESSGRVDDCERADLRRVLEETIDALPDDHRVVFVLRELEQLSTRDTAVCLGLSEVAVKTRLHRAKSRLRDALSARIADELGGTFAFDGARCDAIVAGVLAGLQRHGSLRH